jgi:hypothetical protein
MPLRGLLARFNRWFGPAAVAASTERTGASAQGPDAVGVTTVVGQIEDAAQSEGTPAPEQGDGSSS